MASVRMTSGASRRHGRTRGQSFVEFAMILPVFALLFAATLDLGRLFYAQITLTNAAREGAFQAAKTPFSFDNKKGCLANTDATQTDAENWVVCRVILESRNSFFEIQPDDISRTCDPSDCPRMIGSSVTVSVNGRFTFATPLVTPFFGGQQTLTLRGIATAQRQFVPTPIPSVPFGTAQPTQPSGECDILFGDYVGQRGVYPPNITGQAPATAADLIRAKGLVPVGEGDLTSGKANVVREQNPDASICVKLGSEVHYKYRP